MKASGRSYVYYHCYRKERRYSFCPEPGVEEHAVDAAYTRFFSELAMPTRWITFLVKKLHAYLEGLDDTLAAERGRLQSRADEIEGRRRRHRDLMARGVISEREYAEDVAGMDIEAKATDAALQRLRDPRAYLKPWIDAAELLRVAKNFVDDQNTEERSEIARTWSVNSIIRERTVLIQAQNPLRLYSTWSSHVTMRRE